MEERSFASLVDSGSNRTLSSVRIFGCEGIKIIRELGLPPQPGKQSRIRTANGQVVSIPEEIELEVGLEDTYRKLRVGLLPTLAVPCILGVDFFNTFGIIIDFASNAWYLRDELHRRHRFTEITDTCVCSGLSEITTDQQERLEKFFTNNTESSENPGVIDLTEHHIDVGQNRPIKQRCYLVSPKVQEAIREEVDKMLAGGIIESSFSKWSNPIVMVKKPNSKYRFCLDFRKVNNVSKKDAYPLPNMNGILDKLRSALSLLSLLSTWVRLIFRYL